MGVRDLLRAVLVDRVVVAGVQRRGVAESDLLLAQVAFTLDALAVHAGAVHAEADVPQERLHPGPGQQCVVDVVVARRGQPAVALLPGFPVAVVEDDELQLGGDVGLEAVVGQASELGLEDLPGRGDDRGLVEPVQVGRDQGGSRQPGGAAQRGQVGDHGHVAVAARPAGHGVPVDRIHVHVDREQVIAALRTVRGGILQEEPGGEALADQAALHVGEGHDDGVDVADGGRGRQFLNGQIAGAVGHELLLIEGKWCAFEPLDHSCGAKLPPISSVHFCPKVCTCNHWLA